MLPTSNHVTIFSIKRNGTYWPLQADSYRYFEAMCKASFVMIELLQFLQRVSLTTFIAARNYAARWSTTLRVLRTAAW